MMSSIGLAVKQPENECKDVKCPFHGQLKVRGKIIDGVVANDKMQKTITVTRRIKMLFNRFIVKTPFFLFCLCHVVLPVYKAEQVVCHGVDNF